MPRDHLIAWAAGLYDGEGSASMYMPKLRKTARRQMQVSQAGIIGAPPDVLVRFRAVVGVGNVTGPYRGYLFYWKTTRTAAIDEVARLLWPYLSHQKRAQFETMTLAAGRALAQMPSLFRFAASEVAWAAGFFDGEGSITLSGPAPRRSVRLEISQASSDGIPETLARFHSTIARGVVNGPYAPRSPWSRLPQYRWTAGGRHQVSEVLHVLWPFLSPVKRATARAVAAYLDPGFDTDESELSERSSSM